MREADRVPLPGAPFLVGVTGKRHLQGRDKAVREAFDRVFDILDRELPRTPKVVVTSLAEGADTIAAEAALDRPGWRVVAPLPFSLPVYERDFASDARARLDALIQDPRVTVLALAPLRRSEGARRYRHADLVRGPKPQPERTLHYEQAGLFIVERVGLMIAVAPSDERPARIGGAGRIIQARLAGFDDKACEICHRSAELLTHGALSDVRSGALWRICLDDPPSDCLPISVELPHGACGDAERDPLLRRESLAVGKALEEINQHVRPTPSAAGATEQLAALREGLSRVQRRMKRRVELAVWTIAGLFAAAIAALETHVALRQLAWATVLSLPYFLCAAAAVALYVAARAGRWQPMAEDFRGMSEALRIQLVAWQSGMTGPKSRVDLRYLHGESGSLRVVRDTIGQLVEGLRLLHKPVAPDAESAERWATGQCHYFARRILQRGASVGFVHAAAWFLFAVGLMLSAGVAAMLWPPAQRIAIAVAEAPLTPTVRLEATGACAALFVVCFAAARWAQQRMRARRDGGVPPWPLRLVGVVSAIIAGLGLGLAALVLTGLVVGHTGEVEPDRVVGQSEELLVLAAVLTTSFAGAIRFVSEKLSWEAELETYEHAHDLFNRAQRRLMQMSPAARRQWLGLVEDLVGEALRESESWLLAHRERPLEPVVGG